MTIKLAAVLLALLVAWFVLFRPRRGVARPKRKPPAPQALEPCPECGVYRLPTGKCECPPQQNRPD